MSKYREVYRCKKCQKIYPAIDSLPYFCAKCGEEIADRKIHEDVMQAFYIPGATISFNLNREFLLSISSKVITSNCEKIVAKRKLFGWIEKEGAE